MQSSRVRRKTYPIIDSPLYRLKGKGQIAALLGASWEELETLVSSNGYRVWTNDRGREIQQPLGALQRCHERIGALLARITVPPYVYSVKGRSYIDNARQHLNTHGAIKTDIRRFYPSTTARMVRKLFRYRFECAADVADLLTRLCCYQDKHLPTGSPLSGRLASLVAEPMFDEIQAIADEAGCKLTVYVDDITLSGPGATPMLLVRVRSVIRSYGYRTSERKSIAYPPRKPRVVTGVAVVSGLLAAPNLMHLKIRHTRSLLKQATGTDAEALHRRLTGQLESRRQIQLASEAAMAGNREQEAVDDERPLGEKSAV